MPALVAGFDLKTIKVAMSFAPRQWRGIFLAASKNVMENEPVERFSAS